MVDQALVGQSGQSGQLALVATPIGNLGDITVRAVEVLTEADRVLAEDTRRARALLTHLGIERKSVDRLDAHSGPKRIRGWVKRLQAGERLALITDAGTPLVADPGAALVRAAAAAGQAIVPVPGPSAVMAALSASGLVAGGFRFFGFLPRSGGNRRRAIARLAGTEETAVLFESPRRVGKTLRELADLMPGRAAVLAREMTKLHEEFVRGTLAELSASLDEGVMRGEITLVLGPAEAVGDLPQLDDEQLDRRLAAMIAAGLRPKEAAKAVACETERSVRDLYRRITNLPK
jgi:16S rRNA (cytidine1402-2'-O)-methyltransferase